MDDGQSLVGRRRIRSFLRYAEQGNEAMTTSSKLREALQDARDAISSLPEDALGYVDGVAARWSIKAELLHNIDQALQATEGTPIQSHSKSEYKR